MGHGDEPVLAVADGYGVPAVREAILPPVPLDGFVEQPAAVRAEFPRLPGGAEGRHVGVERVGRLAFSERARKAFGVVADGETALSGGPIIKEGAIPPG